MRKLSTRALDSCADQQGETPAKVIQNRAEKAALLQQLSRQRSARHFKGRANPAESLLPDAPIVRILQAVDILWPRSESAGESAIYQASPKAVDGVAGSRPGVAAGIYDSSVLHAPPPLCKVNSLRRPAAVVIHQRLSVVRLAHGDRAVLSATYNEEKAHLPAVHPLERT